MVLMEYSSPLFLHCSISSPCGSVTSLSTGPKDEIDGVCGFSPNMCGATLVHWIDKGSTDDRLGALHPKHQ